MSVTSWLGDLGSRFLRPRGARGRRRPPRPACRPGLERLDDRCLPSAGPVPLLLDPAALSAGAAVQPEVPGHSHHRGEKHAQPFVLTEDGQATFHPDGTVTAEGAGVATLLGHFTSHREATLAPVAGTTLLRVEGTAVFTGENGDQLFSRIEGFLDPSTGTAALEYYWEGGTGQFRHARGEALFLVQVHPDGTFHVDAAGDIRL
jgi:hypothetical protein